MYSRDELFLHQNDPLVSAETAHRSGTYIILYWIDTKIFTQFSNA